MKESSKLAGSAPSTSASEDQVNKSASQGYAKDVSAASLTGNNVRMSNKFSTVDDIYINLLKSQREPPSKLGLSSPDISMSMRRILVDWIIEVAEEYKLVPETLFLSVAYTDMCLQQLPISRSKLQLLGITCVFIAAKYEEIYAPQIEELCFITDNSYDRSQIIEMERIILKCLDFSVTLTTTKTFLTIYLSKIKADQLCSHLASFLSEVTLMRSVFLQFPPAVIAAAATVLAEFYLCREKPQIIPFLVDLDTPKLRQCIDILHADMMAYEPDQFQAIHEKYSEHKYAQVTSIVPRVDPLNVLFG